jgi:alpha-galactosidase
LPPLPSKLPRLSRRHSLFAAAIIGIVCTAIFLPACLPAKVSQASPVPTPPMGWNSWDSYGLTVTEPEIKANAQWMSTHLKQYGWQYIVVDEGWYLQNPESNGKPAWQFTLGPGGLYMPAPNRFPSAQGDLGFKPLADYIHSLGLKFGIHIIRGVPREAVAASVPLAGSPFHAKEAADPSDVCYWQATASGNDPGKKYYWNSDNYGVRDNAAGQAYYDSMAKLYAGWGVDLVKVDCIANPYRAAEIRMFSRALAKTGRPIVLSLSPGPTPLTEAADVREHAQMWRISNDVIDSWNPPGAINPGIKDQFAVAAQWAPYSGDGHWPDGDMLPIGYLGPRAYPPRQSRLTRDEQQTLLTLWSMFRSPLILGGNLPSTDPSILSLLTNSDVIAVDQHSSAGRQVFSSNGIVVWLAKSDKPNQQYLAVFNLGDANQSIHQPWRSLELGDAQYSLTDLWNHRDLGEAESLTVMLAPHACVLYRLQHTSLKVH